MKKFTALSFVALRFSFLACFGLMGLEVSEAKQMIPCHQMQKETASNNDCDACELTEDAWSQPFVQEVQEFVLQDIVVEVFDIEHFFPVDEIAELSEVFQRGPPDDVGIHHAHLISQKTTLLLI